eukprot:11643892-Ditylum_brightwellii.AAC.1
MTVGLYGRTVVHLVARNRPQHQQTLVDGANDDDAAKGKGKSIEQPLLPSHRLTVGDEVEILSKDSKGEQQKKTKGNKNPSGVICALDE